MRITVLGKYQRKLSTCCLKKYVRQRVVFAECKPWYNILLKRSWSAKVFSFCVCVHERLKNERIVADGNDGNIFRTASKPVSVNLWNALSILLVCVWICYDSIGEHNLGLRFDSFGKMVWNVHTTSDLQPQATSGFFWCQRWARGNRHPSCSAVYGVEFNLKTRQGSVTENV